MGWCENTNAKNSTRLQVIRSRGLCRPPIRPHWPDHLKRNALTDPFRNERWSSSLSPHLSRRLPHSGVSRDPSLDFLRREAARIGAVTQASRLGRPTQRLILSSAHRHLTSVSPSCERRPRRTHTVALLPAARLSSPSQAPFLPWAASRAWSDPRP